MRSTVGCCWVRHRFAHAPASTSMDRPAALVLVLAALVAALVVTVTVTVTVVVVVVVVDLVMGSPHPTQPAAAATERR